MNLHEYQAKRRFAAQGIPIPEGQVADGVDAVVRIARQLGGRVVVKAQVLVGGRGKAGGIVRVDDESQARTAAQRLFTEPLKGLHVLQVLVERAVEIREELYLGLALDRQAGSMALIASSEGGVDIEETARSRPEAIHSLPIDPLMGLRSYAATRAALAIGLPGPLWRAFGEIAQALYRVAQTSDATLAEINPLVITSQGTLLALDAKMALDDNALFRHPDLASQRDFSAENPIEHRAREAGISYIKLDGQIGCMVNGAGLAMATMDVIKLYGGQPANFLDIGGGARADRVATALAIILSDPDVRSVLINIFGGITRCDEVASGIIAALSRVGAEIPIVVRLVGTNQEEGERLLREARLPAAETLADAACQAVQMAGRVS
jgi:succinyl-CoA synthetase beta subunit